MRPRTFYVLGLVIGIAGAAAGGHRGAHADGVKRGESEKRVEVRSRGVAQRAAEFANVTLSGVQAGWLVGGAVVSGPTRRGLDYEDYVVYQQDFLERSSPVAPLLMPATTVANIVPLVMMRNEWRTARFWLTAAGLLCNLGVVASAAAFNVPANEEIKSWSPDERPANWEDVRDRWETGQSLRTLFAVGAFTSNAAVTFLF